MSLRDLPLVSATIATCVVVIVTFPSTSFCQEKSQQLNSDSIQIALVASQYQIDSGALPDGIGGVFKRGSRIIFGLLMTDTSSTSINVFVAYPLKQNRPQLFRDGQLVPYRDEINGLLSALDDPHTIWRPRANGRRRDILLEPNKPAIPEFIELTQWYEPLEPGHYQLVLQHRLGIAEEPWITCSSITFDVVV